MTINGWWATADRVGSIRWQYSRPNGQAKSMPPRAVTPTRMARRGEVALLVRIGLHWFELLVTKCVIWYNWAFDGGVVVYRLSYVMRRLVLTTNINVTSNETFELQNWERWSRYGVLLGPKLRVCDLYRTETLQHVLYWAFHKGLPIMRKDQHGFLEGPSLVTFSTSLA